MNKPQPMLQIPGSLWDDVHAKLQANDDSPPEDFQDMVRLVKDCGGTDAQAAAIAHNYGFRP